MTFDYRYLYLFYMLYICYMLKVIIKAGTTKLWVKPPWVNSFVLNGLKMYYGI